MGVSMGMSMRVSMRVSMAALLLLLRHQRVRNQMQEGVAEQAAGGEAEQHLQQRLVLLRVVQRDEHQQQERRQRDQRGRTQRSDPDVSRASLQTRLRRLGRRLLVVLGVLDLLSMVVLVLMLMPIVVVKMIDRRLVLVLVVTVLLRLRLVRRQVRLAAVPEGSLLRHHLVALRVSVVMVVMSMVVIMVMRMVMIVVMSMVMIMAMVMSMAEYADEAGQQQTGQQQPAADGARLLHLARSVERRFGAAGHDFTVNSAGGQWQAKSVSRQSVQLTANDVSMSCSVRLTAAGRSRRSWTTAHKRAASQAADQLEVRRDAGAGGGWFVNRLAANWFRLAFWLHCSDVVFRPDSSKPSAAFVYRRSRPAARRAAGRRRRARWARSFSKLSPN